MPAARRPALQPKGPPGVEPAGRAVQGPHQARQPQRLALRARERVRRGRPDGPGPRAVLELPGAHPRLLRRPGHRVRGRPAGLRQPHRVLRGPRRGRTRLPLPRGHPARRKRARRTAAHRHQPPVPAGRLPADRRLPGLDHRGPPDLDGDLGCRQPGDRQPLARRLHPRRHRGGRGPGHVFRLLQSAEALGVRDLGDRPRPLAGGAAPAAAQVSGCPSPRCRPTTRPRRSPG